MTGGDPQYCHLVPLLEELAPLEPDDLRREQLRDKIVTGFRPVAVNIARRFANRGEPLDDLVQVAMIGLIHAVDRFEPARGSDFLSFAVPTVTGEVRRHFRDRGWSMRVPRRLKDMYLAINGAVSELSQQLGRRRGPARSRFFANLTQTQIGERVGTSQRHVSRLLAQTLARLRARLDA